MAVTTSKKNDKPYDSAFDHRDKGDYEINILRSYSLSEMMNGNSKIGHWYAFIVYKTKTHKIVRTDVGDAPMRMRLYRCYPNDLAKDEIQRKKAYDRMLPYLESFRKYREIYNKRYEVVRHEKLYQELPLVPDLSIITGNK